MSIKTVVVEHFSGLFERRPGAVKRPISKLLLGRFRTV